jgi:branched-chain amino acid transport system substrate-binding protein
MAIISRRHALGFVAGAAMATASAAKQSRAQGTGPIKIPFIVPLSGPFTIFGEPIKLGAEITVEMINQDGGVLGRPIELIFRDDKGRPTDAAGAAQEMIGDGHNLLIGGITPPLVLGMLPKVKEANAVLVTLGGIQMGLTHENYSRNMFRSTDNDWQRVGGLAKIAADKFPDVVKWGAVISESQSYIESYDLFQRFMTKNYEAMGKKLEFVPPVIAKFGTTDMHQQISALTSSGIDGLYHYLVGADGVTFWQQAQSFALPKQLKAVIDQTTEIANARAMKKNIPPHMWSVVIWYYGLYKDNPLAQRFFKDYVARTNDQYPSGFAGYGNVPIVAFAEAIKTAKGATDSDTIIRTLEGLPLQTIRGPVTYRREDHHAIGNLNFIQLSPSDEDPGFKVTDAVSLSGADLVEPPSPGIVFKP